MSEPTLTEKSLIAPLAPLPEDPELYFEESWQAGLGDLDANRRPRLDSVARYLQDLGLDHLVETGFDDIHPYWVVQRTVIEAHAPAPDVIRERLTLRRWCSGIGKFWCNVRIQVVGDKGSHFETEAFWINFNKETKGPARMCDDFVEKFGRATENHHLRWKPVLGQEPSASAVLSPWQLRATDIDQFRHVNNAAYWEAVEDLLSGSELLAGRYRAIIEYISPVQPAEQIVLSSAVTDEEADIWFLVEGKAKAVAKVIKL
ncbi:acyl-ACP thioesterase [Segniliparus rotundus DSM 44985]|uniref:Acyl-ACP thioesterase n=1 Tax=Segniliparus rotundus (strain ATCC BAA-972 / CDC 1076 / CIP 108378 / DSM 44985 / JCM 13578) TaxID=640132 RepID=D6ZCU7_SEGRD|nr:acyl-ACP thioesterase domain-containing protein [Segniliparus rotundus]ADG99134.1 acyl-ACP thioesterase [Segniliparus rotundus DSM 44985]